MVLYLKANDFLDSALQGSEKLEENPGAYVKIRQANALIYRRCPWKAVAAGGCSGPRTGFISWVILMVMNLNRTVWRHEGRI